MILFIYIYIYNTVVITFNVLTLDNPINPTNPLCVYVCVLWVYVGVGCGGEQRRT